MAKIIYRYLLLFTGCLSILLGLLGIVLPLLPTTPFFILALGCFARSSSAFHRRLLTLPYIGDSLSDWEKHRKIDRRRKPKIYLTVIATFFISILLLHERLFLQLLLLFILLILLFFIYSIAEK